MSFSWVVGARGFFSLDVYIPVMDNLSTVKCKRRIVLALYAVIDHQQLTILRFLPFII